MKRVALNLLRTGHLRFFSRDLPRRIALCFHELEAGQVPAFRAAMDHFRELGYQDCSAGRFADPEGPARRLLVSFDDNFRNWHSNLAGLEASGVKATFYTNSAPFRDQSSDAAVGAYFDHLGYHGDRQTLSRQELRELDQAGHRIGCHSHSHPVLSRIPRDRWHGEIAESKAILEEIVDRKVVDFSFPYGMRRHFSPELVAYCASIGFETVATAISCQHHADHVDPMAIHRTTWRFDLDLADNLARLCVDGRAYAAVFGRSAVG